MFEYVRNIDSAVQWFTNTYLLDECSAKLTHGEITKLASVI